MPASVVGGLISGAGAIGGAILSSKAQKKASKTAAQAQLDVTAQNNALAREQYAKNQAALAPWQQRGNAAGQAINALLGIGLPSSANDNTLPNSTVAGTPIYGGTTGYRPADGWVGFNPVKGPDYGRNALLGDFGAPTGGHVSTQANDIRPAQTYADPNQQYQDAFSNYRNSTGYNFRVNEGARALNAGFAGKGTLRSGAAMKAFGEFGQNIASGEFNNYLNSLFSVSNQGLSAANAQAGVGSNLVNAVTNNNNNAAGALGANALAAGNANAQMWGAVGNAFGNIGSGIANGLFSSSFAPPRNDYGIAAGSIY